MTKKLFVFRSDCAARRRSLVPAATARNCRLVLFSKHWYGSERFARTVFAAKCELTYLALSYRANDNCESFCESFFEIKLALRRAVSRFRSAAEGPKAVRADKANRPLTILMNFDLLRKLLDF